MAYGSVEILGKGAILQKMISYVVTNTELTDLLDGSVLTQVLSAAARSDENLYYQLAKLTNIFNLEKASGEDLDLRLADYGLTRLGAQHAQGTGQFTVTDTVDAQTTVPAGTLLLGTNGQTYKTLADAILPLNQKVSGAVAFIAASPGKDSNCGVGVVTQVTTAFGDANLSGLAFSNTATATGGASSESDIAARARAKSTIRELNRTSPDALESLALGIKLSSGETVKSTKILEDLTDFGKVVLYIDNGSGTAESTATVTDEVLITSATGGEFRFKAKLFPLYRELGGSGGPLPFASEPTQITLKLTPSGGAEATVNSTYFYVKSGTGQIVLNLTTNDGSNPFFTNQGLTAGDRLRATYTHYTGLVRETQLRVDGYGADLETYKGGRAAGCDLMVRAPETFKPEIAATVVVSEAFDEQSTKVLVKEKVLNYINGLPVGADVILAQIIEEGMTVPGVFNMFITTPAPPAVGQSPNDIAITDSQIARADTSPVTIS